MMKTGRMGLIQSIMLISDTVILHQLMLQVIQKLVVMTILMITKFQKTMPAQHMTTQAMNGIQLWLQRDHSSQGANI